MQNGLRRNLLNFCESEDEEARSSFIEYFDTFCYRYILWICHQNNPEKIRLSDAVTFILNIVTFRCARFRSNGWSHLLRHWEAGLIHTRAQDSAGHVLVEKHSVPLLFDSEVGVGLSQYAPHVLLPGSDDVFLT